VVVVEGGITKVKGVGGGMEEGMEGRTKAADRTESLDLGLNGIEEGSI